MFPSFLYFFLFSLIVASGPVHAQEPQPVGSGMYRLQLPDVTVGRNADNSYAFTVSDKPLISGDIRVIVEERDDALFELTLTLPAANRETASAMFELAGTKTRERQDQTAVHLDFDQQLSEYSSLERARLRVRIALPTGSALELESKFLQVQTDGPLSLLRISECVAPVTASGIRGRALIRSSGATVKIADHIGALDLRCERAQIRLTDIEIDPEITSPGVSARIETTDERVIFTRYSGPLLLQTSQSHIRGRSVEVRGLGNRIENIGGKIDVRFTDIEPGTKLDIVNSYEDISLHFPAELDATVTLENDPGGTVTVDGIPHQVKRARDYFLELLCGAGAGKINATTNGGGEILVSASQ